MLMLVLDSNRKPLALVDVSTGIKNQSLVHPQQVIGAALNVPGASSIWLAHNHPSGDTTLSPEDRRISQRLNEAADNSGLYIAGFMVVGENGEYLTDGYDNGSPSPDNGKPRAIRDVDIPDLNMSGIIWNFPLKRALRNPRKAPIYGRCDKI
jgi:hypothetical protein